MMAQIQWCMLSLPGYCCMIRNICPCRSIHGINNFIHANPWTDILSGISM
jgi:hypothetical protein